MILQVQSLNSLNSLKVQKVQKVQEFKGLKSGWSQGLNILNNLNFPINLNILNP